MSYAIRLQSANFRKSRRPIVDAQSGWSIAGYVDLGLTDEERRDAIRLLTSKGGHRPGIDDRIRLTLSDGSPAEVHLVGLHGSGPCLEGTVSAPAISLPFLHLVVELATRLRLILRPDGFPRPLVVSEELRRTLIIRYPTVQTAFSAAILLNLLVPRELAPAESSVPQPG